MYVSDLGRRSVVSEHRQALVWSYVIARCHNILHIALIHPFGVVGGRQWVRGAAHPGNIKIS